MELLSGIEVAVNETSLCAPVRKNMEGVPGAKGSSLSGCAYCRLSGYEYCRNKKLHPCPKSTWSLVKNLPGAEGASLSGVARRCSRASVTGQSHRLGSAATPAAARCTARRSYCVLYGAICGYHLGHSGPTSECTLIQSPLPGARTACCTAPSAGTTWGTQAPVHSAPWFRVRCQALVLRVVRRHLRGATRRSYSAGFVGTGGITAKRSTMHVEASAQRRKLAKRTTLTAT